MSKKQVKVGGLVLGDGHIAVQSMTTVKASDVEKSVAQILRLEEAGCEISRVAVADEAQLGKILSESAGVIEKQSLRTWTVDDVLAVYDNLSRAHESINKLQLVPDSF